MRPKFVCARYGMCCPKALSYLISTSVRSVASAVPVAVLLACRLGSPMEGALSGSFDASGEKATARQRSGRERRLRPRAYLRA